MRKYIIVGGSGFLGRTLARHWADQDIELVILSRKTNISVPGARVIQWDGKTLGDWADELNGSSAVINLAGRSVNCRYTPANREQMIDSRVQSTTLVGEAIRRCETPPPVWINSSTATIYKHRFDTPNDETTGLIGASSEANDAFSIEIAKAWETAFHDALNQCDEKAPRGVIVRTAMVFGNEPGGVYEMLARLVRYGLGGKMGNGRQWVSWLHADDFCRSIDWLLETDPGRSGIYNLCAPEPLTNRTMMTTLRYSLGRKFGLPATRWMLEIGAFFLRTETELILKSRRVVPARLIREGFEFQFTKFCKMADDLAPSQLNQS